eukprot:jgi/Chrpa1/4301/Chrysochromulina_OHIO_Genome00001885-RA
MVAIAIRGSPTSELAASADGRSIMVQRPRTTLKKTFTFEHVVSTDTSTAAELYETAVAPALDEAFPSVGCCVIAMGSEQSGKSRTVRGNLSDEGVAVRAVRDAFAAARRGAPEGGELLVTLSAVLDAIVQGAGETPLQGKQPVRERLLDALQPTAGQPAAGLIVRENADALPHARRFFVEGLSERIAHSVDEAEALVREAFSRCADEEASRRALRVHLLLVLTLRRRAPDGSEHVSELSVLDVAGVPRPRSSADAPTGAGTAAASRGRGGAAGAGRGRAGGSAGRAGGSTGGSIGGSVGGVGEDPFVKALYRIVDVLQEAKVAHVPYRDSKLTRLIAEALGGPAHLLPLLHMRSDRFDEAEAVLLLGQKLQRLCAPAGVAGGALRLPRGLGGVKPPSGPPLCTVREDGWWNPLAEMASAEALAAELCEQLGVRREGLVSSSIALDADSTDELLHLQEALLLSERLEARCASWGGGVLRLPPPPAFVPPPRVPMAATAPVAPPLAPSSPAAARALPPPPAVRLPWLDSAAAEEVEEEEAAGAEATAPESPAETVAEPPFTAAFTAVGETEARPRPTKMATGEAEILAEILGGSFGCRPPSSHRLPAAPTCPAATTAAAARSGVRALDSGHSVAAAPDGALRENPAGASTPPVDHSKLALVKRSAKPRPFVPTPGGRVLAQYDNGEWYAAKVRATSRAADGAQLYVVAFDEDGLVQHLPAQRLRAPRTATPQAPRTASRHS